MSIFSFVWTVSNNERFMTRVPFASEIQTLDYVVALALVFMIIEVGRRTLGISISIITLAFIAYAFLGPYCPASSAIKESRLLNL